MSHNDYVRPNGQWPPETVLTPGDLRRFDVAQFQAVNGDAGGTWVPLTPITIGGLGLVLTASSDAVVHKLLGGVQTWSGGRVYLGTTYPRFATDVSRAIAWPILVNDFVSMDPVGSVFGTVGSQYMLMPIPPRQLHNGSTLSGAGVTMQVGAKHLLIPQFLPTVQIVRDDWVPWIATRYPAGAGATAVASGAYFCPSNVTTHNSGLVYVATIGGTTSGTEPNWTSVGPTINSSFTDGSVTWVATGYTPDAAPTWTASTSYTANHNAYQPTAANGLLYVPTSTSGSGTSGTTEPTWPLAIGGTVTDNQVVWTCVGSPRPAAWTPSTVYKQFERISVSNGYVYEIVAPGGGTSGSSPPAWSTTFGVPTTDGTCTWDLLGTNPIGAGSLPRPATADAYYAGGVTQTMSVPCYGTNTEVVDTVNHSYSLLVYEEYGLGAFQSVPTTTWTKSTNYFGDGPSLAVTSYVQPTVPNGFYYMCTTSGTSSSTTEPTWPTILGNLTSADGSTQWECVGVAQPSNNVFLSVGFSLGLIADMGPE